MNIIRLELYSDIVDIMVMYKIELNGETFDIMDNIFLLYGMVTSPEWFCSEYVQIQPLGSILFYSTVDGVYEFFVD